MVKKPHYFRTVVMSAMFALFGAVVVARLAYLQIERHEHYVERANAQHNRRVVLQPERGDILDRVGRPLAQSTGRLSVYINPRFMRPPESQLDQPELARQLAEVVDVPADALLARIRGNAPSAVARALHPDVARRVADILEHHGLDARGFWLHRETRRVYPRNVAANVIGFCSSNADGDNIGIHGIEQRLNNELAGRRVESRVLRTAIRESLEPVSEEQLIEARGNTVVLTIDALIQEAAERAIAEAVTEFGAAAGGAVAYDVRTGEVLAMASYPTFDNNDFSTANADSRRNRITSDPFETGSVIKLYTAAIMMDMGIIGPDTMVDCEGGHAVIEGRRVNDAPGHDPLHVVPFRVALRYSSNVGIIKPAQQIPSEPWHAYLKAFGCGSPTRVGIPGETGGILYPVEKWGRLSRTSLPMGYELSLSAMQIVAGIGAIANDGQYMQPHIIKEVRDPKGEIIDRTEPRLLRTVVRPTTSAMLREMMAEIVLDGTGKKAQVAGYKIGGKTGTTVKSHIRDRKEYISSFVGVVPIDQPAVAIYVFVDTPTKARFGGTIAAPAFAKIARAAMLQLGIPPSEQVLEEDDPKESLPPGSTQLAAAQRRAGKASPTPTPMSPSEALQLGLVPDFKGLTLAEMRPLLPRGVKSVRLLGTGVVTDQSPAPGEPATPTTELIVHLSPDGTRPLPASASAPDGATAGPVAPPTGGATPR